MNKEFWENRYRSHNTGWDLGEISTPLKEYIDQLENRNLRILIPGAGNAYEAEYLFRQGFPDITVVDMAIQPLENFRKRIPENSSVKLIQKDFFQLEGEFDLILEQTFFCAIPVNLRKDYAKKSHELLAENGKIAGLLFDFPLTEDGPPFGGNKAEYLTYFSQYFKIEILERSYNSIKPRAGKELFFKFRKIKDEA